MQGVLCNGGSGVGFRQTVGVVDGDVSWAATFFDPLADFCSLHVLEAPVGRAIL